MGVEPTTYTMRTYRSSQLSYCPTKRYPIIYHFTGKKQAANRFFSKNSRGGASDQLPSGRKESNPGVGASDQLASGRKESNPIVGASDQLPSGRKESNPVVGASDPLPSGRKESNPVVGASDPLLSEKKGAPGRGGIGLAGVQEKGGPRS